MTAAAAVADLISKGYRVIPVKTGTKEPAVKWQGHPGLTIDELDRWFGAGSASPHGVGILTGEVWVIDVDDWAAWKAVCALHGWDPEHPPGARGSVATPSGGRHFYYRCPAGATITNKNTFPAGIDVRGGGGFVVAPPTPGYRWV